MHMCYHAYPEGTYSGHLTAINATMIDREYENMDKLFMHTRAAIDRHMKDKGAKTQTDAFAPQVIVFTSGGTLMGQTWGGDQGIMMDVCIKRINRATRELAHKYGFAVLERGEMEQRIMYKNLWGRKQGEGKDEPIKHTIQPDMHLPQPVQVSY